MTTHEDRILKLVQRAVAHFSQRFGSQAATADLEQEAFLILLNRSNQNLSNLDAYVFRIVRNLYIDLARKRKVSESRIEHLDFDAQSQLSEPLEHVLSKERLLRLHEAISELPPRCQDVLRLKQLKNLSNQEIAKELGISVSMVEKHISRGFEHCAFRLRELYP